jgi:hypothetical protein
MLKNQKSMKNVFRLAEEYRPLLASQVIIFLLISCIGINQLFAGNAISGGTKVKVMPGTYSVSNNHFILKNGAVFNNNGTLILQKDFINANTVPTPLGIGTINLKGNYLQTFGGRNLVQDLVINNSAGVKIGGSTKVDGVLSLINGIVSLGDNYLILGTDATVLGDPSSNNMIDATAAGELQKQFPPNFTGNFTFPIGDNNGVPDYSPVTFNYIEGSFNNDNYIGVNLRNCKHPDSSVRTNYIKRYWCFSQSGVSDLNCSVVFKYVQGDVIGKESDISCLKITSENVINYGPADTINHQLLADTIGTFGSFTGGSNIEMVGSITGPTRVCQYSSGNIYTTQAGKSNYSWNISNGGIITAGGSNADNFVTVTWNTAGNKSVSVIYSGISYPATLNVTVDQAPVPTITGPSVVCQSMIEKVYSTETGMLGYQWNISQGGTITAGAGTPQITVLWTVPGERHISVNYINGAGCTAINSTMFPVTVNAVLPVSVSIAPNANGICAGTSVTFNAIPVNGGTNPYYQWFKNSVPVGTNSPVYTFIPLNGDIVKVILTSSEICQSGPAISNPVTMIVNPVVPVSVSIQESANQVCEGTSVSFTATPVNGGTNPVYQWYKNSVPVGTNSPLFSYIPVSGDIIKVVLTSSEVCQSGPATSNRVTMTVNPILPVSVTIQANANQVCAGTSVTFNAYPVNGGTNPTYQWYKNSVPVGTNNPVYSCIPANGDIIKVILSSSEICQSGPATSNVVTMIVNPPLPVSVTIQANANQICAGTSVAFNAFPVNGGTNPDYQWYRNSIPVGTNSPIYTCIPENADIIKVLLTSSEICQSGPAISNEVTMVVNPSLPVSVTIQASATQVCEGSSVTFNATPVNGGANPFYQWYKNSVPVGSNSPVYSYLPVNGDVVKVVLTSSEICQSGPATSNVVIISVNPLPVPTITGLVNVCAGTQNVIYKTETDMTGYSWTISSGGIITAGNETSTIHVTWNEPGEQLVKVNYTNSFNCNASAPTEYNIHVNALPVPNLTGNLYVCNGTTESYSTEPGMNNYTWTVSSGGTINSGSESNTVTVTWNTVGTSYVKVNYTTPEGCSAANPTVKMVYVRALPVPSLYGSSIVCLNTISTFTTEPGMSDYEWVISPAGIILTGTSSSSNEVNVKWTKPGPQWISVNYTNGYGCTAVAPTIKDLNVTGPTISGDADVCKLSTAEYTTEGGKSNYDWYVYGGNIIAGGDHTNHATIFWYAAGNRFVKVTYTDNGCTATSAYPVIVHTSSPSITGPSTSCNLSTSTYVTDPDMSNYSWTVSTGGVIIGPSNTSDVEIQWVSSGQHTIKAHYKSPFGCNIDTTKLIVNIFEIPSPSLNGPAGPFCMDNGTVIYTTEPNQLNYVWELSSGIKIISGGGTADNTVEVKWIEAGEQWISVNYTTKHYCTAVQPTLISVVVNPAPEPTISGPTSVDLNTEAMYETESGMSNYQWKIMEGGTIVAGGGVTDDYMTVHWYGEGMQQISLSYANASGCAAIQPTYLDVDVHQPIKFPSANTSFDNNPGNSNSRRITAPEFMVYPVPNYGKFTISIDSPDLKDYSIQIFNSLGSEIYLQKNIQVNGNYKQNIDISNVAEGIYTIIVNNGDTQASKRIHIRK